MSYLNEIYIGPNPRPMETSWMVIPLHQIDPDAIPEPSYHFLSEGRHTFLYHHNVVRCRIHYEHPLGIYITKELERMRANPTQATAKALRRFSERIFAEILTESKPCVVMQILKDFRSQAVEDGKKEIRTSLRNLLTP